MYAICYPTQSVNRDSIREEMESCIKYGTYNPPRPAPLKVLANSACYNTAVLISKTLADREQRDIEVRAMTLTSGISATTIHISVPTPTPLQEAISDGFADVIAAADRLDAFDGVPADTKEGSQIR